MKLDNVQFKRLYNIAVERFKQYEIKFDMSVQMKIENFLSVRFCDRCGKEIDAPQIVKQTYSCKYCHNDLDARLDTLYKKFTHEISTLDDKAGIYAVPILDEIFILVRSSESKYYTDMYDPCVFEVYDKNNEPHKFAYTYEPAEFFRHRTVEEFVKIFKKREEEEVEENNE